MRKKKPRNYAATETTLINLRVLKRRVTALERSLRGVWSRLDKPESFPRRKVR